MQDLARFVQEQALDIFRELLPVSQVDAGLQQKQLSSILGLTFVYLKDIFRYHSSI
jgi:hypothetical protein